jgi:hypothetical protein
MEGALLGYSRRSETSRQVSSSLNSEHSCRVAADRRGGRGRQRLGLALPIVVLDDEGLALIKVCTSNVA